MGRYRTINVDLNRQYRNDLNANFAQIEQDILAQENFTVEMKNSLLTELARIEQESKDRDNALAKQNLEVLLQSIEDAKANANTAASNANLQATHATEQGNYAKTQGDYAKTQGDYAQSKGDYADEKAILADEAAANANLEASNLSQLKVDVVTATQNANLATENTNTAITNANNAATYATEQGDYAKAQGDAAREVVDNAPVVSVNGQKGVVNLTASDIGAIPSTEKGVAGGIPTLNAQGKVVDASGNEVEGKVKTVNNVAPDETGNIEIPIPNITDLQNHVSNNSNPHGVTKSQVGLGSVQNYGVATQAEAEVGTATNKYMTPQRTAQAIAKLTPVPTASQITIADTSNLFTATDVESALSELFTNVSNGKSLIATAITDKGVITSGSEPFETLANNIRQISGGKKWATGSSSVINTTLVVNGLDFTPSIIIARAKIYSNNHRKFSVYAKIDTTLINVRVTALSADIGSASVNFGSFTIEVDTSNGYNQWAWVAIE